MAKNKFGFNDVIDLLIKRAKGFYYTEEQFEYEKTQKNSNSGKNSGQIYQNISFFDNPVRGDTQSKKLCDTIKLSNGETLQNNENLTLVKKKVSTHYISPDMLAIKILFEIFGEKVDKNEIDKMTDNELINLKNQLLKELKDEDNQN